MILNLVFALVLVGVLLYLIDMIPMDGTIKRIIHVVVIIACILYVLRALGLTLPF